MANGKRGRVSICLVPRVLRDLRGKKGLSQRDVGNQLVELSVRSEVRSAETLTHGYQRIERTGHTSPKTAAALAKLFGVSVAVLEGKEYPDPADYQTKILSLLEEQLRRGGNSTLEEAQKIEIENGEDGLKSLAQNVCYRIEKAQLARNPEELNELIRLTGLSLEQLLEPANADGHWLVTISARDCVRTDIVRGAPSTFFQIKEVVGNRLDRWGSDGAIRMRRDGNWYRLEIEQALVNYRMRIDFARCQPHADGLRWVSPSWWDEFSLDELLTNWAYTTANFVSGRDGIQCPADVENLRLIVKEFSGNPPREVEQVVISTEIPEYVMGGFAREAQTHWIVQKWLESELREFLLPRLQQHSKRCWDISTGRSGNVIDIQYWPRPITPDVPYGLRYRIQLVEEIASGEFKGIPWRSRDRNALRDSIEKWLN